MTMKGSTSIKMMGTSYATYHIVLFESLHYL